VFNLAAPDERRECRALQSTNPDHLIPSKPSPMNVPPLRMLHGMRRGDLGPGEPAIDLFPISCLNTWKGGEMTKRPGTNPSVRN
jgi:hypothetical protein